MSRKLLFVFNPHAGRKSKKKEELPEILERFCEENSFQCKIYKTTGQNDEQSIQHLSSTFNPDAVIAVGGDGTVNMVGEILVNSSIPLGIIPQGSANGLAKDLRIPKQTDRALQIIKEFSLYPIDTLKVDGKNCFHMSDFGFNAGICHRFSESILRGKISYVWFGLLEFFTFKRFFYKIESEGKEVEGKAFMITVTNANRFGTNVNINPLGKINDGFFEISIIKPFSKLKSFKVLYKLLNNTIHQSEHNKVIKCREATIYNKENTSFHIDGNPVQLGEKIEIKIVPEGLTVIIPCCR